MECRAQNRHTSQTCPSSSSISTTFMLTRRRSPVCQRSPKTKPSESKTVWAVLGRELTAQWISNRKALIKNHLPQRLWSQRLASRASSANSLASTKSLFLWPSQGWPPLRKTTIHPKTWLKSKPASSLKTRSDYKLKLNRAWIRWMAQPSSVTPPTTIKRCSHRRFGLRST